MRALVVATPAHQIAPEALPEILQEALGWSEQHAEELEQFGLFPGGGGFGVVNVADEAALHQMMLEMPFSPFNHHDIYPFVEGRAGLRQAYEAMSAHAAH